jgi:hypothetical protein
MAVPKASRSPAAANPDRLGTTAEAARDRNDHPLIEPDPNRPGEDRTLLAGTGIPVWAIVAHLQALTGADVDDTTDMEAMRQAATDYRIDESLVVAAVAYYRAHRHAIDARLARNAAAVS